MHQNLLMWNHPNNYSTICLLLSANYKCSLFQNSFQSFFDQFHACFLMFVIIKKGLGLNNFLTLTKSPFEPLYSEQRQLSRPLLSTLAIFHASLGVFQMNYGPCECAFWPKNGLCSFRLCVITRLFCRLVNITTIPKSVMHMHQFFLRATYH